MCIFFVKEQANFKARRSRNQGSKGPWNEVSKSVRACEMLKRSLPISILFSSIYFIPIFFLPFFIFSILLSFVSDSHLSHTLSSVNVPHLYFLYLPLQKIFSSVFYSIHSISFHLALFLFNLSNRSTSPVSLSPLISLSLSFPLSPISFSYFVPHLSLSLSLLPLISSLSLSLLFSLPHLNASSLSPLSLNSLSNSGHSGLEQATGRQLTRSFPVSRLTLSYLC